MTVISGSHRTIAGSSKTPTYSCPLRGPDRSASPIADWADATQTGLRHDLQPPPNPEVWDSVNADSSSCSRRNCDCSRCFYQRARARVRSAQVIVVNHALLFSLIAAGGANPGDLVELFAEGKHLVAMSNGIRIGVVEPRVAARLLKLITHGNKYAAGVTSLGAQDVRIIIREVFQDPRNYGKVSFPTAAKSTDLRPYTKGTLLREDEDLEDELEDDVEDDEIEDLDRVLPADVTPDEAFEEEPDELDEP